MRRPGTVPSCPAAFTGSSARFRERILCEDAGVMDQAIDGGERHSGIGKDLSPFAEGLVGGDQQGPPLVAGGDELEQHGGLGLALLDVGEVVED